MVLFITFPFPSFEANLLAVPHPPAPPPTTTSLQHATTEVSAATINKDGGQLSAAIHHLDPDSMGSLDPYPGPNSQSGSGSRKAKITHKQRKKFWTAVLKASGKI
jgi:hypothetical protein